MKNDLWLHKCCMCNIRLAIMFRLDTFDSFLSVQLLMNTFILLYSLILSSLLSTNPHHLFSQSISVQVLGCVHICACTCMCICVCTCVHGHMCMWVCMCMYVCTCMCVGMSCLEDRISQSSLSPSSSCTFYSLFSAVSPAFERLTQILHLFSASDKLWISVLTTICKMKLCWPGRWQGCFKALSINVRRHFGCLLI